jgi:RimJ/RimL family protein N-acetyltransferase
MRDLRLEALSDPLSPLAFGETYTAAAALPEGEWRARAAASERGERTVTFVAVTDDGAWAGMATAVDERELKHSSQAQVVGVYVPAEYRGAGGPAGELLRAVVAWVWEHWEVERIRLHVHEENRRAHAFYLRLGFAASGRHRPASGAAPGRHLELELARG